MKKRRVLLAGLFHETNTFVEGTTTLGDFAIQKGAEIFANRGDSSPIGGALDLERELNFEWVPAVDFRATPSGWVKDSVFESYWEALTAFRHEPIEAIFLVLHGAMACESIHDAEGELLRRIRSIDEWKHLPVVAVLDLHANFTQSMADFGTAFMAYRKNPHTDARLAAENLARMLRRILDEELRPVVFWQHTRMLWPAIGTGTAAQPMEELEAMARAFESANANFLAVNVIAGFAHADIADAGTSFNIITCGPAQEATAALAALNAKAWELKDHAYPKEVDIQTAMNEAKNGPFPCILAEPADNIGGGAPGDCTTVLRALLEAQIPGSASIINDPEAVAALQEVEPGESASIQLGGKGSSLDPGPVTLEVKVLRKTDGQFCLEDPHSHAASMHGNNIEMGPTVVARSGEVLLLITSFKTAPFDLGQWRSQGIEPSELSLIDIKAAVAYKQAYDKISRKTVVVDVPGPVTSNLLRLPYKNLSRPIFPIDSLSNA